ncbi:MULTISPECIES: DUF354 domain-containing protein [Methanococcoides]|jgi:predicted glycosyltransferase|uniref:DUF354 domain-containing protein n=1 Tax=Methanococcoides seepicolus TaxID=2828780 RepID=A0A9E4ZGW5_9EURY|nr:MULTISPECIES: DUF354 domain-containing protein [Methanococcoides]MCM1986719.1 DUF354 domain-containing protein [Methanococcoides seepicolus]
MNILVGISHPKHVYMFKNFINEMGNRGHQIKIVLIKKDNNNELLDDFNLDYIQIGENKPTFLKKLLSLLKRELNTYNVVRDFKPDVFIGQALPSLAHISFLVRKPYFIFEDTEHATQVHYLTFPFTKYIVTQKGYWDDLGKKQIHYNGYFELNYLHPNHFQPDPSILEKLGLAEDETYSILRFVSWEALHDQSNKGFSLPMKRKIVRELEKYGKVFISSEKELPEDLRKYQIQLPASDMHYLMNYATLFMGESSTMASECAVLGTPAIFIDFCGRGYTNHQEAEYGLVFNFKNDVESQEKALEKAIELISDNDLKNKWETKRERMLKEMDDGTQFMVKLIEDRIGAIK